DHHSATHAVFIIERQRVKYGIDLALGFDLPVEINPAWFDERPDLPTLSCDNSTCFGYTIVRGTASKLTQRRYNKAPIHGSSFNITFCPKQEIVEVKESDEYPDE
ncbi:hypothetical protein PMAYCL1PPCAC_27649, partial [Pristionchus mayeri]